MKEISIFITIIIIGMSVWILGVKYIRLIAKGIREIDKIGEKYK